MEARRLHCGGEVAKPPYIVSGALRPLPIFPAEVSSTHTGVWVPDTSFIDEVGQLP